MEVFIQAAQTISPQDTFPGKTIPDNVKEYSQYLKNVLPDFKNHFPPIEQRRMNTLIKTALVCASETIKEAGHIKPDAIITGTGLGCVADTEKFLHSILDSDEGLLTPTAFIQSTHNIVGALIAINLKCYGYNVLFAHKTVAFDHALLDAFMHLQNKKTHSVLVGGFDEITEENYCLKQKIGLFKKDTSNTAILNSNTSGCVAGEGSSFFVLGDEKKDNSFAIIKSVRLLSRVKDYKSLYNRINESIIKTGISPEDIDLVITGINGDKENDEIYYNVLDQFPLSTHAYYKHLCGEFDTASAFGMWFCAKAIKEKAIPSHSVISDKHRPIKNVLLYNQNNFSDHSMILFSTVD